MFWPHKKPAGAQIHLTSKVDQGHTMARVYDVAQAILERAGPMSAMKLQKLVYYCQAWSLVWDERPMFAERIEAWRNGPVCPELFKLHRGQFLVISVPGAMSSHLSQDEVETVEAIVRDYGALDPHELSAMTHSETPWREARGDLPPDSPCAREITHESMYAYYSAL